jgi:hypothetical protein
MRDNPVIMPLIQAQSHQSIEPQRKLSANHAARETTEVSINVTCLLDEAVDIPVGHQDQF